MSIDKIREDLKARRKKLGLNMEDSCVGFSRHTLSRFESGGDIMMSNLDSLAAKFGWELILLKRDPKNE